jgi:UDP-N-acetylmuramoyl-L-alanyl-D-glutamate--2,6-diaminopimelate ligase
MTTDPTTPAVPLTVLARAAELASPGHDVAITGIAYDSRRVRPGELFVALPGARSDGAAFVVDAVARGAVAVVVGTDSHAAVAAKLPAGVPLLSVADPHAVLGRLAAAFHDHPARRLRLVGITGTLGKTSTALLVQGALATSARAEGGVGVIGSLGARIRGAAAHRVPAGALPDFDGMTTPDAPVLHRALRVMADAGVGTVAMEVTSHALAQRRVEGLVFALGLFTNLVPDEHLEYHATPEDYLRTKARFLTHLAPGAPLVANADDARVVAMIRADLARAPRPVVWVSLGAASPTAAATEPHVRVEALRWDASGSTFVLDVRRPLPLVGGDPALVVAPQRMPVVLPLLGVQQVANAALAAVAALVAGATPHGITEALAEAEPMRRRMEVVRAAGPMVLDDTAGNPETLHAVFASVADMRRRTLRVAFGVRGLRGPVINARLAEALAELIAARSDDGPVRLVVTTSDDVADARNRVRDEERDAARTALDAAGVPYAFAPRLDDAIAVLLDDVKPDDVVLLLGAQGMDRAAPMVRERLAART